LNCGSVTAVSGSASLTQGTVYNIWLEYHKGTGANAVCKVFASPTTTKPVSTAGGDIVISITNGDATESAVGLDLHGEFNTTVILFDRIRVSSSDITGVP
jgi:hypothetical protein